MMYTFLSLAARNDYSAYEASFERTIQSFQPLTDPKRLNVQPRKITVRKAGSSQTLKEFLTGLNVPADRWKTIEFLNSLTLETRLERGRPVKITN
jgi:predicted Zn-dependent protease